MGGGSYSYADRSARTSETFAKATSVNEVFTARGMSNEMSPKGVKLRESRDSAEHPNSVPIVLLLDLTGSMTSIPFYLVKEGLPNTMQKIMDKGIKDPQILFAGVGDHEFDNAPLQIGQFETSDTLLDHWLTTVWLEKGGGNNAGESYLLGWFFAAMYTAHDHMEKRGKKGYLFTIGDEPTLMNIPKRTLEKIMGDGQYANVTADEILKKVSELYHVFHIHVTTTSAGRIKSTIIGWKQLLADHLIVCDDETEIAQIIANKVAEIEAIEQNDHDSFTSQENTTSNDPVSTEAPVSKPKPNLW